MSPVVISGQSVPITTTRAAPAASSRRITRAIRSPRSPPPCRTYLGSSPPPRWVRVPRRVPRRLRRLPLGVVGCGSDGGAPGGGERQGERDRRPLAIPGERCGCAERRREARLDYAGLGRASEDDECLAPSCM